MRKELPSIGLLGRDEAIDRQTTHKAQVAGAAVAMCQCQCNLMPAQEYSPSSERKEIRESTAFDPLALASTSR